VQPRLSLKQYLLISLGIIVYLAIMGVFLMSGAFGDPVCPPGTHAASVSGVPWIDQCKP